MRRIVIAITFVVCVAGIEPLHGSPGGQNAAPVAAAAPRPATEQAWILADVMAAIEGMSGKTALPAPVIATHIWSPATYRAAAEAAFDPAPADADLDVRASLTQLTSRTLVDQSTRVSFVLERSMRMPAAHEAAALVVGAFALRESSGWFHDVRPSLSRMAAHLAVAAALRRPSTEETLDGALARVVLGALVGHQRQAMAMLDGVETRAASDADRAWVRALRLRITGDWRTRPAAGAPLLVQLEYARAVRVRLDVADYLDVLDRLGTVEGVDWARIAFFDDLSVEAGQRFTGEQIQAEWSETALLWMQMNGAQRPPAAAELVRAIDERPAASPVERSGSWVKVRVLDWGMWASHQQRHLAHAFIARAYFANLWGNQEVYDDLLDDVATEYVALRLFPFVLRWMAEDDEDYELALRLARPIVRDSPEVVPQRVWTMLLEKPRYASRAAAFPLDQAWFTPAVPAGTAFELSDRALRQGCPRPPTREQAATWAREQPYDHWTVWGHQWLGVDGRPAIDAVRTAFGPLAEYDSSAVLKLLDYMNLQLPERIELARVLCALTTGRCDRLGELLLVASRAPEAAQAYGKWADGSRDRVGVSNGVTWLFRYHVSQGATARADALSQMAEDVGSRRGLELRAEWHERQGRPGEAEKLYRQIEERYDNTVPLGTFLMRRALASHDEAMKASAAELLRDAYPLGPQPLVAHALPATAGDGVRFATFGPRPESLGFERGDIIVGVDGWRVHNNSQYLVAVRFSDDENMTFTVFRHGRYQELRVKVPERWLGTRMDNVRR